jgi:tetratricopeptide (TPR) repeat protein
MSKLRLKNILFSLLFCYCVFFVILSKAEALNLEKARIYFLNGDYSACINEGEKILSGSSYSRDIDNLYYLVGLSYLKEGNYLRASDIFEIILTEFKNSRFQEEARLGLGDTYFLRGEYNKATGYYKDLLTKNFRTKFAGLTYYRLSQCAFKTGKTAEGQDYLYKLKKEFPLSLETIANKDLTSPVNYYTVQIGSFSSSQNARNLEQKLIQRNYPAYIEESTSQGKTSYRVRVGRLASRQEAVNLADKLSREGYPTKICP